MRVLGRYGTVGLEMGLSVAVGFFGGRWLDGLLGTEPWLKWIGLGFGLAAGFRALYRVARQVRDELDPSDDKEQAARGAATTEDNATDDDDGKPRTR